MDIWGDWTNKTIFIAMEAVKNEKGEWVIPASRRPDGTWRKEKVMRAGYMVRRLVHENLDVLMEDA